MRYLVGLLLIPSLALADGPLFRHNDKYVNQEFDNVYHDLRNTGVSDPLSLSSAVISNLTTTNLIVTSGTVSYMTISSAAITNLTVTTGTIPSAVIRGAVSNTVAAPGRLGEFISSAVTSVTNAPTSNTVGDLTSIILTPGDWDMTLQGHWRNGTNTTSLVIGIGTASGDDQTGFVTGQNQATFTSAFTSGGVTPLSVSKFRTTLSASTTYYYKYGATYTGTTPDLRGTITARRPQ